MCNKDSLMFSYLKTFLIMPIDFDILFFINVLWSNHFNLLSIMTPKKFVLFTLVKISYLYTGIDDKTFLFNSCTMKHHVVRFQNLYS